MSLPTQNILVVDDDPMILKIFAHILRSLGFQPLLARGGAEALGIFRERGEGIAAVLLDYMMPDMSGFETFHALKAIDPGVRVILVSGYGSDGTIHGLFAEGLRGFLPKPFRPDELATLLTATLAADVVPAT